MGDMIRVENPEKPEQYVLLSRVPAVGKTSALDFSTAGAVATIAAKSPVGRRGLFAMALAGIVAACAGQEAPKPVAVPLPTTPADPAAISMADKIKLVADTVGVTLPKLGIDNAKLTAGASIVSQLAALGVKLTTSGGSGGGSLASIATSAVGLISKLGPIAGFVGGPYGMIISAAVAMGPAILQLAGIHARQAPGAMPPHEAEAVLRHARGY